jgi:hypothetical protein
MLAEQASTWSDITESGPGGDGSAEALCSRSGPRDCGWGVCLGHKVGVMTDDKHAAARRGVHSPRFPWNSRLGVLFCDRQSAFLQRYLLC